MWAGGGAGGRTLRILMSDSIWLGPAEKAPDSPPTWTSWLYGLALPVAYLVVELSFCNQLIHTLGDASPDEVLNGLEFWGRVISGVGLGILLHRLVSARLPWRVLGFCLSITAGIAIMWNVQRALIDHLVETASPQDKRAALLLVALAPHASSGQLQTLEGHPVVQAPPRGIQHNITVSMFPAAALHADRRDLQFAQWVQARPELAARLGGASAGDAAEPADRAYRALIVAPLVIGLSLLFALLNLSLALSFVLCVARPRWRPYAVAVSWVCLAAVSWQARSPLLDAQGYARNLRPTLWQEAPVLALMVEWSTRTATRWASTSEVVHRYLLFGYNFRSVTETSGQGRR